MVNNKYMVNIRFLWLFVLILAALVAATPAQASHFRFGHFTWESRPDISPETADFRMTVAFRSSYFGNPDIGQTFRPGSYRFGDGSSVSYTYQVIARNLQEDWIVGQAIESGQESGIVRHTYPAVNNNGNPWTASFTSCCKIGSLRNGGSTWRVNTLVNLENGNSSPVSNLPPIVTCGKFDCRFNIPAVDPNGDVMTYRLATRSESAISSIPAGIELDENTGLFTWTGADAFTNGLYTIQVIIEDRDDNGAIKSNVAIDFILSLQDQGSNAWPEFDFPPTPERNSIVTAIVGQPLDITVQATDPDPNDEVFLNHVGLPLGATFTQTTSSGETGIAHFEWAPSADDIGRHIVTFLANDSRGGASSPVAITIDVIEPAISDVRVVSTISTDSIELDTNAFSIQPAGIDIQNDRTVVTWEFPSFDVSQVENLDSMVSLFNVQPNEQRIITEKLELFYTDIDGQAVYELLDEQKVTIAPSLTTISIDTDKELYLPGDIVEVGALIRNLSNVPVNASVELSIVDSSGDDVASLGIFNENGISAQGQKDLPATTFDTTDVYAGAYEAVAVLREEGSGIITRVMAPFAVTTLNGEFVNIGALVNTDKPEYDAWDQVVFSLRTLNLSSNGAFDGGLGELIVETSSGDQIVVETYTINSIAPEALSDRSHTFTLEDAIAGAYDVRWTVRQNGDIVAISSASFSVNRSELESLLGVVAIEDYPTGEAETCSFETSRRGAGDGSTNLIYQLVSLDSSDLIFEHTQSNVDITVDTPAVYDLMLGDPPAYGEYACVLMAEIDGEFLQLAAAGFEVRPPVVTAALMPSARGKLLVLIDNADIQNDENALIDQKIYLDTLLVANGWNYLIVDSAQEFTSEYYSGEYGAIAVLSEKVNLDPVVEDLLVEAQHSGVGLVIGGGHNRRNNQLERRLGVELTGNNKSSLAINLIDGFVVDPIAFDAPVPEGLALAHCNADVWAVFASGKNAKGDCAYADGPAAVTATEYGNGSHVYFAYDWLDVSTSHKGLHDQLFLSALTHIQPQEWPAGSGRVVPVDIQLENVSRKAAVEISLSLPVGGYVLESDLPLRVTGDRWVWQHDFASPNTAGGTIYVRLPTGTSGEVFLEADVNAGINHSLITDISEVALKLGDGSLDVANDAMVAAANFDSVVARSRFVLAELEKAESHISKRKINNAIKSLLKATAELSGDSSDAATELRLAIGEWLFDLKLQLVGSL